MTQCIKLSFWLEAAGIRMWRILAWASALTVSSFLAAVLAIEFALPVDRGTPDSAVFRFLSLHLLLGIALYMGFIAAHTVATAKVDARPADAPSLLPWLAKAFLPMQLLPLYLIAVGFQPWAVLPYPPYFAGSAIGLGLIGMVCVAGWHVLPRRWWQAVRSVCRRVVSRRHRTIEGEP